MTDEMDRLLKAVNEVEHLLCEDEELLSEALEALNRLTPEMVVCECGEGDESDWCDATATITKLEQRLLEE